MRSRHVLICTCSQTMLIARLFSGVKPGEGNIFFADGDAFIAVGEAVNDVIAKDNSLHMWMFVRGIHS